MQNGNIRDRQVTASTNYNSNTLSIRGRLHCFLPGTKKGGWCSNTKTAGQYLQVDLRSGKLITKIATQGRHTYSQWVTEYILSYMNDETTWSNYEGDMNCTKVCVMKIMDITTDFNVLIILAM